MTCAHVPSDAVVQLTQQLLALVAHLDNRRYAELADLFLPGGRWLRQGRWFEGREAILAALQARPADVKVRHAMSNILVTAYAQDEARVDACMTAYRQLPGRTPELFSINRVDTLYRRVEGRWRVAEQQMVREFEFITA